MDLLATSGDITMTWTSPIIPKLYSNDSDINPFDKPINAEEESWIGSLINIGAMIGPFPFGYIAGRFGRKIGLLCIAIPHIISYLTLAFSKSVYLYYFARTIGGIAVGGGYTLLPMYVAEVTEDSNRGMFSVTLNIFWTFGNLLSYVIGPYTSITWFNVILACVPTSFFILFLLLAPETPYYLLTKNQNIEAEKSLLKLRSNNKKLVDDEIKRMKLMIENENQDVSFFELFKSKTYFKGLFISFILIVAQQLSGVNAVMFYTQEIFSEAGADNIAPEIASIIIGLICFSCSFVVPFVADRAGRRIFLMISCFGSAIAHLVFGIFFYLKTSTDVDISPVSWLPLASLIFYFIMFTMGLGPLPWTVSSELFPTNIKPFAAALVSFSCWTTSFFVTKFFGDLNNWLGVAGTFWIFGGACFLTFIFILVYVPETKEKSFAEIQEILDKNKVNSLKKCIRCA